MNISQDDLNDLVRCANPVTEQVLLDLDASTRIYERARRGSMPNRKLKRTFSFGVIGVSVASLVLLAVLTTSGTSSLGGGPAAAALRKIALAAGDQSITSVPANVALYSNYVELAHIEVTNLGNSNLAVATSFTVQSRLWVSSTGQPFPGQRTDLVSSDVFGPLQFASSAARTAWITAGLGTSPSGQGDANGVVTTTSPVGPTPIVVSGLPTTPQALGSLLAQRTTGIPELDTFPTTSERERIARLLIGPDVGTTPQLLEALYEVLSDLPGVTPMGPTVDHQGRTGLGFEIDQASGSLLGPTELIVNPETGALLEARNIVTEPLIGPFLPTTSQSIGVGTNSSLSWVDVLTSDSPVSTSSVPIALPS